MRRVIAGIFIVSSLGVVAAGCGGGSDTTTETGPAKVKIASLSDGVIVKVGDHEIKKTELDQLLSRSRAQAVAGRQTFPKDGTPQFQDVQRRAVENLVLNQVIKDEAKKCGKDCDVPDSDIDKRIKELVTQNYGGSEAKFNKFLTSIKLDRPQARDILLIQAQQAKLSTQVTRKVRFTEADAQTYYAANKATYAIPAGRHAFHILVKTKALAQTISSQATAANFAALAKKYGTDSTAQRGGDLSPLVVGKGQFVPEFDTAAKKLKDGQISGPVKTQFGWHVIRVVDQKASQKPFDAVKAGIIQEQLAAKQQTALQTWQTGLIATTRRRSTYANRDYVPADQLTTVTTKSVATPGAATASSRTETAPATP